jgi:hypothetical protein
MRVVRPASNLLGVVNIEASYSEDEIEKQVVEVVSRFTEPSSTIDKLNPEQCQSLVSALHALFLQNGDRDEFRQQYGADPVKWYLAACELSIIHVMHSVLSLCQIGTQHVYLRHNGNLNLISPIHNVQSELRAGTIESSCLSPFGSRSNEQIADQLLLNSPRKLANQLAKLTRQEFEESIGHVRTRVVGYFPDPYSTVIGTYRKATPEPSFQQRKLGIGDSILFYLPKTEDSVPYAESSIRSKVESLALTQGSSLDPIQDSIVSSGQLLSIAVTEGRVAERVNIYG